MTPERTAPSIVAGNPVCVQSPASARLVHCVFAGGRLASSSGVAAKVARVSRTICHAGIGPLAPVIVATSDQSLAASSSRGSSSNRSAALIVTDSRFGKVKSHSTSPLMTPVIGGSVAGRPTRKCALTMARYFVGVVSFGISAPAAKGGTARMTASSLASEIEASPKSSAVARVPSKLSPRSRRPKATLAPQLSRKRKAGVTSASERPLRAIIGR